MKRQIFFYNLIILLLLSSYPKSVPAQQKEFFLIQTDSLYKELILPNFFSITDSGSIRLFSDVDNSKHLDICTNGSGITLTDRHRIRRIVEVKDCSLNGYYVDFSPNGIVIETGYFVEDQKHGPFYFFNDKGELVREEIYNYGDLISERDFR